VATILVVDDESQARTQLGALLCSELGHDVLYALDGRDAIDIYAQVKPDLVITDLVMPGLHGLLLIDHLTTFYPGSRIIAISGKEPDQLHRAIALGAAAALRKPIQRELLVDKVERLLPLASGARSYE
jgi:CheY-like chemotaxis protein